MSRSISVPRMDRVFVAELGRGTFELRRLQVHRWIGDVRVGNHIHWDVLGLHRGILDGIRVAGRMGRLDSIGIDSWGVDYGLLDADGALLGNPVHYRDDRTRDVVDLVVGNLGALNLYRRSGIAVMPFNTIFQLVAGRDDAQFALSANPAARSGPARLLAYGFSRRRRDERLNDPIARDRRIRVGRRTHREDRCFASLVPCSAPTRRTAGSRLAGGAR